MAERCNEMKNRAKNAQDMSLLMYLAVLVKKQSLVETAYVMDLGVKAFCVYVPRLGLEDRIMIEKIPNIKKAEIKKNPDSELRTLYLEWDDGRTEQCGMFEPLLVQVGVSATVPYIAQLTVLPKPSIEEQAQ
ncbi:hypothetical protein BVRB_033490 [Beta vulgaris subsp. vulgaris]|uniref:DIS3L2 C-terminal domain-containing protein n=1 Tax=Beta vulgaris subsp. vulgaris TaxID=3555 RepID=A0A0J8ARJ2_BETVV|nr:hypothetical protein BVRB_033490 [Beta vulgaris subsp. vulgaris]